MTLRRFLWQGACHQRLVLTNHGLDPMSVVLTLHFAADYADIYQVRGMSRKARGSDLPPEVSAARAVLGYHGLDGDLRRTVICFDPAPAGLSASNARFDVLLAPREERTYNVAIGCEREPDRARSLPHPARSDVRESPGSFEIARAEAEADLERYSAWSCHLHTSNAQVNAWVKRATSDLHMLTTELPTGPYPYAGVPWFNTPFGRDGIITALECLWLRPALARGVLSYLASTQAIETIPEQDAEPGKILHETRNGEMATLREMPFGRYYGSVDATPLFVVLAGAYYQRTGDRPFIEELWPHVRSALGWIEEHGDRDQDGFVEYERRSHDGLVHQGWRDTDDAVFHADAALAEAPIALCEVQGYVYAAWRAGAVLAKARGAVDDAARWSQRAAALRERFEQTFWCEDLGTYALALDGAKRPCRVRTSNAGQCLFTGIVSQGRAGQLARALLGADFFSGWGVRTVAASEPRYNPMSYHNGAVWPHDTALIAQGLRRYGFREQALRLWTGLFEAALSFDQYRMPELFCGFPQSPGEGPTLYPVACAPQAWAAASVFLLFQACLGLEVDGILLLLRHDEDVGVTVLRREGDVRVLVAK